MTFAEMLQEMTYEIKSITPPPAIFADTLENETETETPEQKYDVLAELTISQYIKWLKKHARQYGRRAGFGNGRQTAVEVFVAETTGLEIGFLAGGEIEIDGLTFLSGWTDIAYYTYEDDGTFVRTFGKALKYAEWQADQPFIVDWQYSQR